MTVSVNRVARIAAVGSLALAGAAVFGGSAQASVTDGGFHLSIVAGNGTTAAPVPGPATGSPIGNASGVAFDRAGDMFIASYNEEYVFKVTSTGQLSVFAGNGSTGTPVAGPATSSPFKGTLNGLATDTTGNVYVADQGGYIEKITPAGQLSVFAGNGTNGTPVPGPATSTSAGAVTGVATNAAGDVFISANNGYVEKVTPTGTLSIFAGNGGDGSIPLDGGPATKSPLVANGVATDAAGNVYIADDHGYVEKVTPAGTLSIVAGNGNNSGMAIEGPARWSPMKPVAVVADHSGDIYIVDRSYDVVEKVTRGGVLSIVAGNGYQNSPTAGFARWSSVAPNGLAWSPAGFLYEADYYGYVTKLVGTFTAGSLPKVSGTRRVGYTLRVRNVGTNVTPTTVRYQWLRNGVSIRGAHGATYRLVRADRHRIIKVKVTYSAPSYTSRSQVATAGKVG